MVLETPKTDMLSIRKVKLHGMSEPRWTSREKIIQYKGLINLYRRDKKIALTDKSVALKKDMSTVYSLKRKIADARDELDTVLYGNRQSIVDTLAEKKQLLLPCKDLHPDTIIEHITQVNFNYRKQLDLLTCRKNIQANKLVNKKLLVAKLEKNIIDAAPGQLPIEMKCQILTAHVKDADLKKEATIVINESYKKIIRVCRKDAIYFDAILSSLRTDRMMQGECMLNAIILGQLATEYLFDRVKEFRVLEHIVKRDMIDRKIIMDELILQRQSVKNFKFLVRKDSDATLPVKNVYTNADIREELDSVCEQLDILKESFHANSYTKLSDCLYQQRYQEGRLRELTDRFMKGKDTLQNKIDHTNLMYEYMYNTMIETTFEYKQTKKSIKDQIQEKINEINECNRLRQKKADLIVKVKSSLQHLEQVCKSIKAPYQLKEIKATRQYSMRELKEETLDIKANCLDLVDILVPKLVLLAVHDFHYVDNLQQDDALMKYAKLVSKRTRAISFTELVTDESLVGEDIKIMHASVPTRADIKARSRKIVKLNTKKDDLVPVYCSKPRRKWKAK